MIIVTGAAGFIGSCLSSYLLQQDYKEIVLVDDFSQERKSANYNRLDYQELVDRNDFFDWLKQVDSQQIKAIFHLGARTDTAEMDSEIFDRLNFNYSKKIFQYCALHEIPLIYASSAATYGSGEHGFEDNHQIINQLKPLNPYGVSKNDFDRWVLKQEQYPPAWYGLKFFNVYGPNEYHKSRMASVIFHAYQQIKQTGKMKLFQSHHPDFKDGEQLRDFVYVKDVCAVCEYLFLQRPASGIYNLGTGTARTFNDLVNAVFKAMNITPEISYIPTPIDIRDKYQYFTEANMQKLKDTGYTVPFSSLEDGVSDYVSQYLMNENYN